MMRRKYLNDVNDFLEEMIQFYFRDLYFKLKERKISIWNMYWLEWVMTLFIRSFDLHIVMVIWDYLIVYGDLFIIKIFYAIF